MGWATGAERPEPPKRLACLKIQPWHGGRPTKKLISCSNDHCHAGPSVTGETQATAIRRWNSRKGE